MAKFSRSRKKRIRYRLTPKEAQEVIRQEFTDSRGNKHNIIYDVTPQKWNSPIIEIKNQSKYNPNGE